MEGWKEVPLSEHFRSLKGLAGQGLPGTEPPIRKLLQPPARHASSPLTSTATSLCIPEPNSQRAVKAIPRLCQCQSAFPAASGNLLRELITHCEKVIYPQIPEHRALSGWCPLIFEPCCF